MIEEGEGPSRSYKKVQCYQNAEGEGPSRSYQEVLSRRWQWPDVTISYFSWACVATLIGSHIHLNFPFKLFAEMESDRVVYETYDTMEPNETILSKVCTIKVFLLINTDWTWLKDMEETNTILRSIEAQGRFLVRSALNKRFTSMQPIFCCWTCFHL